MDLWKLGTTARRRYTLQTITKGVNKVGYIVQSLSDDEEVKNLFKLHWLTKLPIALWIILIIPSFGFTALLAVLEWFRLRCTEQGATNKRVILKTGIFSRKTEEMKISSIETVEILQSILGRALNFGTIKITGRGISSLAFKNIANPMDVKRQIESINPD